MFSVSLSVLLSYLTNKRVHKQEITIFIVAPVQLFKTENSIYVYFCCQSGPKYRTVFDCECRWQ